MSFFSKLFQKSDSRAVGLDIGASAIKLVQLHEKNGKVYLDTYGSFALGSYGGAEVGQAVQLNEEDTVKAIKDLFQEANVTTDRVGVAVSFSSSMLSIIEMPEVSEKQLGQMIPLEARKYIPTPLEEVVLDWSVISRSAQGSGSEESGEQKARRLEILLVAIHNNAIERYKKIIEMTGLRATGYEIEAFGTGRAVLGSEDSGNILIMDIGARSSKLYIMRNGYVRASHVVNRGSQDITLALGKALGFEPAKAEMVKRDLGLQKEHQVVTEAADLSLDYLFEEVKRIVKSYQNKQSQAVEKVFLAGGGGAMPGLKDRVAEELEIPAQVARPFDKVVSPPFIKETLERVGPEFAVALGSALRALDEV